MMTRPPLTTASAIGFDDPSVRSTTSDGPSGLRAYADANRWLDDETLLVFDARHACYRAWYTRDLDANSDGSGDPTSALHGLISIVGSVCRGARSHLFVLAWDGRLDHKRRIYPEYKQRKAKADRTPDEALESERREAAMQLAQNTAPLIGMRSACPDIGEADDIAGLIVGMATDLGVRRVCLVTDDRDVLQLIRAPSRSAPEVCVYRPGKDEIVDLAAFRSRYGFDPRRFPDYKSLVGEPATGDNIPGVPGIGDVRAGALVAEHGTLSAIIAACEQRCAAPKPKAYERAIVAHANDARLSLVLSYLPDNQSRFIKTWFAADPDPALAMIARLRLAVTGDHGPSKGDIVNRLRSLGFGSDAIRVACDLAQDSAAAHRRFVSHGSVR